MKNGHLEHLSEICKLDKNENIFIDLEYWFYKFHEACLLTKWTWNNKDQCYIYVELVGVFTDLNKLAKRIKNEINSLSVDKFGKPIVEDLHLNASKLGDTYYISLLEESDQKICLYRTNFQIDFIHLNDTDERYGYEGWKFDLNTKSNGNKSNKTLD